MRSCKDLRDVKLFVMIDITFPDGSVKSYEKGITGYEIAQSISPRLAAEVLAVNVTTSDDKTGKGTTYDLDRPIEENATVRLLKWDDDEAKHVFWHSSSHLMAEALESLYPGIKFGIGPAIENGFYYDVDFGGRQITEADLRTIETKMMELARSKESFTRREVSKDEALKTFSEKGDEYKCELIGELEDGTITFYTNGNFTDLCRGPHLRDTSVIKAVKLTSIAGAYWRGDEKRHSLADFRVAFHLWIEELCRQYEIDREDLFIRDEASGHLLIDECLALLFVVYIEPPFGVYLLERISEMFVDGFTVSDTWLVQSVGLRFTNEELTQILEHHETQQF